MLKAKLVFAVAYVAMTAVYATWGIKTVLSIHADNKRQCEQMWSTGNRSDICSKILGRR